MKKLLLVLAAFLTVFTLSACKSEEVQAEDVVLNWNIGADPRTLDPGLNGASDGGDVINNTFEGLVREKNGEILPGMAESWTVSADGLTVTFNIRDDAKWSDGSALTADDFVRSWLRGMDPRNASEYSWIWEYTNVEGAADFAFADTDTLTDAQLDALADEVGIASLENGSVLEVTLIAPTNWFVSLMAFYHFMPVPTTASIDGEGAWAKDPETALSNGPFTLNEYTVGGGLQLVKNEYYWNADEVGIDVINGDFTELATTAWAKYEADQLDVLPSVPESMIPGLLIASNEFHVYPLLGTYYVNFNLSGCADVGGTRDIGERDTTLFCNVNLRQALALSLNREEIVEALAAGQVPAAGFIPPGFADNNGEDFYDNSKDDSEIVVDDGAYATAVTYFETAATELGMTVAELRTALEAKEYAFNTSEGHQLVGELIQAMWFENLGFTIGLTNEDWAAFQISRTAGDYDLARGGWLTDFMDPSGMLGIFVQGNAYNDPDYYNAAFEAQITAASTATTAQAHFEALYAAHEIFMQDMPVIPIYHYNDTLMIKAKVKGWSRSVLGAIDFSTAYIEE